jgi:hypothetical protein
LKIDKFYIILFIIAILILTFKLENLCITGDESKLGYSAYYIYKYHDINLPTIGPYTYDAGAYPLIPIIILFGETEAALRIAVILLSLLTTLLLYHYVKKVYDKLTAITTSLLFITSPVLLTYRHITDLSYLMCCVILFLILRSSEKKINRYFSYFIAGFSLANIFTVIYFYISFFMIDFLRNRKITIKKDFIIYIFFFFIGFYHVLYINMMRGFMPINSIYSSIARQNQYLSLLTPIKNFIYRNVEISYILSRGYEFWAVYGEPVSLFRNPSAWPSINDFAIGISYILFMISIFYSLHKKEIKYVGYIMITVILLSLFKVTDLGARHLIMILPLFFIPMGFLISNLWKQNVCIKIFIVAILLVSCLVGFYTYSQSEERCYDRAFNTYKILGNYDGKMMMFSDDCGNSYHNMLYFFSGKIQHVGYSSCSCNKDIKYSMECSYYIGSEEETSQNIRNYLEKETLKNYDLIVDVTGKNMPAKIIEEKLNISKINYTKISGVTEQARLSYYERNFTIFII